MPAKRIVPEYSDLQRVEYGEMLFCFQFPTVGTNDHHRECGHG
jgi:hypothetical protein